MARPFPTTFDQDAQLKNQSGGQSPISYQANVNRQKTKKWVDAKAANYGGDDWGDDDDEYEYDEPPPPPASKSAAPWQQGNTSQSPSSVNPSAADAYKKSYGDLPARPRANSFDEDDERRNFSSSTAVAPSQTATSGPPTRFSQITGVSNERHASQPLPAPSQDGPQPQSTGFRQTSQAIPQAGEPNDRFPPAEAGFAPGGNQGRRDYSPAPPNETAHPSGVQGPVDPSARFPARKSSLSQVSPPNLSDITRSPQETQPVKVASPTSGPAKALPFIRPADIYRRAEEERRQSLESGARPSLDTLGSSKPSERSDSPAKQPLRERTSSDSLTGRRQNVERDHSPGGRFLAPALEPVKERKSEYGFDGFNVANYAPKDNAPPPSQPLSDSARLDVQEARRQSTSPKLPDLNRMSGFGMDMFLPKNQVDSQSELGSSGQVPPAQHIGSPLPAQERAADVKASDVHSDHDLVEGPSVHLHGKQSSSVYQSLDDDELAPPRTLTHAPSEQSFRPNLPGGWTSYATTARTETPKPDESQASSLRNQQREPDGHDDIAPTTVKHPLPQTESKAALEGVEGGAVRGEHDDERDLPPPPTHDQLPTPDPSMAPSGNLYSIATLDPRLLPKSEQVTAETQGPPNVIRSESEESLDARPPPPAKDTPVIGSKDTPSGYFQPSLQNQNVPVLAHETGSDKDENDRLEEEIVRRLSPQPRESTPHNDSLLSTNVGTTARESTYLPAEYGDYWASSAQEPQGLPPKEPSQLGAQRDNSQITPTSSQRRPGSEDGSVAPLSVAKSEAPAASTERPPLQQRFSWEQSSEIVPMVESEKESVGPPPPAFQTSHGADTGYNVQSLPPATNLDTTPLRDNDEKIAIDPSSPSVDREPTDERHGSHHGAILGGAALAAGAVGATAAVIATDSPGAQPQRRASLAEEKATRVSSYPINVTPPESEHPARSPEPYFPPGSEQIGYPPPSGSVSPINSPIAPPPAASSRLLAFKEILNMKSSHERRQTFDETRQRFAAMDSGLSNWMETLKAQHPEHADATGFWLTGGGVGQGPKAAKSSGPGGGLQQPYYQQYLNASSPTNPSTPTSAPGPSGSAAYQQQGFPPSSHSSSGKITSQQVQAKGKEFLHTAGVFGGKAGKAGKGLLAKGKSKFRGGGDKDSPEPKLKEPKPKNENRSSWRLATLSKSNSPNPSEKLSQPPKDSSSAPHALVDTQRSTTMTSISSQPPVLPPTHVSESWNTLPGPQNSSTQLTPSGNSQGRQQPEPVTSVREIRDADQSTTESSTKDDEDRDRIEDHLAPPRPIGKHQPSWDPFNATPIAEEQGSAYDTRPNPQAYPFPDSKLSGPNNVGPSTTSTTDARVNLLHVRDESKIKVAADASGNNRDMIVAKDGNLKPTGTEGSVLHQPRGSSFEVSSPPGHRRIDSNTKVAPFNDQSLIQSPPAVKTDRLERAIASPDTERSPVQSESTFLPPIRRTSTFGFKFGSRQAKQRFSISDDEEDVPSTKLQVDGPPSSAAPITSDMSSEPKPGSSPIPLRHERRSLQQLRQEDSGYSTDQPAKDQGNVNDIVIISGPPRPSLSATSSNSKNLADDADRVQQPSSQRQSIETARPLFVQAPSQHSQRSMASDQDSGNRTPTASSGDSPLPPGSFRTSQDAWKPNAVASGVSSPPSQNIPAPGFAPRQSWEGQRPRGVSGSGFNVNSRGEGLANERPWALQNSRLFEQPPSSAQRYPELFKSTPSNLDSYEKENGELPAHYYQQPIPREAAFLPRQQTNEYQLPGVGPPVDEPRPRSKSRRNSSLLRDLGGRLSRATSRERRNSVSQDDDYGSGRMRSDSQVKDDADSSIISADEKEKKKKRRSSFFLGLSKASSSSNDIPKSRDSVVLNAPGSRSDLVDAPSASSPLANQEHTGSQERKNSFFGNSFASEPKSKPSKPSRSSTAGLAEAATGKKKRFSALSGLFGGKASANDGSTLDRQQSSQQSSLSDRQLPEQAQLTRAATQLQEPQHSSATAAGQTRSPLSQDHFSQREQQGSPFSNQGQSAPPSKQNDTASPGSRNMLMKLKGVAKPQQSAESERAVGQADGSPYKSSKPRRSSAAGLLGGILGRKQSHQDEDDVDSSSTNSQRPQRVPPARTYTDLNDSPVQTPQTPQPTRTLDSQPRQYPASQDRGRQMTREPQYDNVPIPGGYSLVRAQGGQTVPTAYDPRGLRFQQPVHQYQQGYSDQIPPNAQFPPQQSFNYQQGNQGWSPNGNLTLQTQNLSYNNNQTHASPLHAFGHGGRSSSKRLSDEDIVARSPALPPAGQQRPYQLSLPEDDEDRVIKQARSPTSPHSDKSGALFANVLANQQGQHNALQGQQRFTQVSQPPLIRHPSSPAGYPLPEDTLFSPVNPEAEDMPPPPPPKDTNSRNLAPEHSRQPSGSSYLTSYDLNRSGTHRTAISAISGISDHTSQNLGGVSPRRESLGAGVRRESSQQEVLGGHHVSSGSPTPPSPVGTPSIGTPELTHNRTQVQDIQTTVLEAPRRQSLDLYDASPLGKPITKGHGRQISGPSTPKLTIQTSPQPTPNHNQAQSQIIESEPLPSGPTREQSKRLAELEGTKADGFNMRIPRQPQEEKIFYDASSGLRNYGSGYGNDQPVSMSATSYPGQEWNPYETGNWEDDDEDIVKSKK